MDNIYVRLGIVISIILFVIFLFIYTSIRDYKRVTKGQNLNEEYKKYLDTCCNRSSLSTSPEALELLWCEIRIHYNSNKNFYDRGNYEYLKQIRSFIKGKYQGLRKMTNISESTWF